MIGIRAATKLFVVVAITLLAAGVEGLRAQGASQATAESCARASFRVVVDVGHTADVPGAMSARGIPEYAFNLRLARDIKQALIDAGFEQSVLLITATAPRLGLVERAARANSMHANLFIAIHHDSVPDNLKRSWDYGGQKMNSTTIIRATRFSYRTIMPIPPGASYSAACSDASLSAAASITPRITHWR
jgi:N-acetylmuramoyl-L-alanine amidase